MELLFPLKVRRLKIIYYLENNSNSNTPLYSPYSPSPFNNSFSNLKDKVISKPISPAEFEHRAQLHSPKDKT